jgi:glycosyltransferase involved in cell wall biosynthesis
MVQKDFSIIIPHFNNQILLKRCLDSIPINGRLQIIVVDDCSSDLSQLYKICNRPNVELIILDENMGAGVARNKGVEKAIGRWLLFCDADDFFTQGAFDILNAYKASEYDIIFFNITSCYSDTGKESTRHLRVDSLIRNAKTDDRKKKLYFTFLEPFGKMYRNEFIRSNGILFENVRFSNDTRFSLMCVLQTENIMIVNSIVYCVTVTKGSLTNTITKESILTRIHVYIRANELLKSAGESRYQLPVINYLLISRKLGIKFLLKTFLLIIKHRQNLFKGSSQILRNVLSIKKYSEVRKAQNRYRSIK